ncbi:uncharacterized protein BJ212DRAFT_1321641 [Suillus subaureus]|uniref:Uncharacterized protein n=1 Tax=Suillus subaureus TaxID=48587 RepID=A0A9P7JII3_9AGAM|nr:uncharacterized protein BJ212DRAFT_1321641 [Suillus subaureus]KAG1824651.1 hypothetical protein BJ212DRAFT_1321641 [Suillus subaureus]
MVLLAVAVLTLPASFLSIAVAIPNRHAAKPAVRGRAGFGIVRLPREAHCAICPEDIKTNGGTATLVFDQGSTDGITMCTYKESSSTDIICPYVTDTGELNGAVKYCPQTVALGDCVNS